jgi:multiple sugar transport system substrate-binding protein
MANDGSLFPGSTTLDMRNGRARWVTGTSAIFFDGPWNIGAVQSIAPEFMDLVGVAPNPTPDGKPGFIGRNPSFPEFWVSAQTKNPKHAVSLVTMLTSKEHNIGLAERMDQPPLMLDVVEQANVHPTYKQVIKYFSDTVRLQPVPQIRNPLVNDVTAAMKDIHPNLGEIIQGAISGEVKDVRAALTEFNTAVSAEREAAIKTVQGKGGEVSLDDWVFSDWTPGTDYVTKPNS